MKQIYTGGLTGEFYQLFIVEIILVFFQAFVGKNSKENIFTLFCEVKITFTKKNKKKTKSITVRKYNY